MDEETGLYYYGARYYDPKTSVWISSDPLREKYPNISSYVYCADNPIKFIDPDGKVLKLAGNRQTRISTLTYLQKLTNDKLGVMQNGTIIIMKTGVRNTDKKLTNGTKLITDLINNPKSTTVSVGSSGSGNSASTTDKKPDGKPDWTNATNGKGANATVNFNPSANPFIPTIDPKTGNVVGATRPDEIGLAHELIHSEHINNGTVDFAKGTNTFQTPSGKQTQTELKEELNTVGLSNNKSSNVTENKIRKEQGLNKRGAY